MVEETFVPGMSVSRVARMHRVTNALGVSRQHPSSARSMADACRRSCRSLSRFRGDGTCARLSLNGC